MLSLLSLTPQPSLPHDTHESKSFCCWALERETEHALFQARLVGAGITHLSPPEQGGNPFGHCRLRLRAVQACGWEGAPLWLAHQLLSGLPASPQLNNLYTFITFPSIPALQRAVRPFQPGPGVQGLL